jgi:hypothetical protein
MVYVLNHIWSLISHEMRNYQTREKFIHAAERQYKCHRLVNELEAATAKLFAAATAFYRE